MLNQLLAVAGHDIRYIGLVVPISAALSIVIISRKHFLQRLPITMIGVMSILQLFYFAFILEVWTREWYFTGWFIVVMFGAAFLLSKVIDRLHIVPTAILTGLVLIAILVVNIDRRNMLWSVALQQYALLQDYDRTGNFLVGPQPDRASYFGGVPIGHLEGKANGYDYIRSYLIPNRVASYISDAGATHYVISNADRAGDRRCFIKLVGDQDVVVYGELEKKNSEVAIYRITVRPKKGHISQDATKDCASAFESAPGN